MLKTTFCALAVATLCVAYVPATQANFEPPAIASAAVRYGDLDLDTQQGVAVLYERLQTAARRVCRNHEGGQLYRVFEWQNCYLGALSVAVGRFELRTLEELHRRSIARRVDARDALDASL